jgi:hypothetical protein
LFWFLCWRTTFLQVVMGLSRSWQRNFHKKAIRTTCWFAFDRVGLFFKNLWLLVAQTSRFPLAWLLQLMRLTNQVHDYNPFFRETLISLYFAQHTHTTHPCNFEFFISVFISQNCDPRAVNVLGARERKDKL